MKVTLDAELYTKWVAEGSSPKTAKELSTLSDIDEMILSKLCLKLHYYRALILRTSSPPAAAYRGGQRTEAEQYWRIFHDHVY